MVHASTIRYVAGPLRDVTVIATVAEEPGPAAPTPTTAPPLATATPPEPPRETTPVVIVPPSAATPRDSLPVTGLDAWLLLCTALVVIAVGTVLVSVSRHGHRLGGLT